MMNRSLPALSLLFLIPLSIAAQEKKNAPRVQESPLDPQQVVATMKLPPDFRATVFAAEDDVLQPIAFQIDHRGRLWVCENFSYPKWAEKGTDRITIFEDVDNDGKHDKRTVFAEGFGYLTGVLPGEGGVWVACAPHLLFYPDRNHDDKPDGPPEIHLEGWNHRGVHNVINGLEWGPDGWIYGANGITVESKVKVVGADESERITLSCSIWRYNPTKKKFDVWCQGTTNPWGIDFNETGQLFFSTSVTPHFMQGIQGTHFVRMSGKDLNPHVYELMTAHTDHLHFGSSSWNDWSKMRNPTGATGDAGGGHSHAGAMIYYGTRFPDRYRGTIFFNNIHGNRINNDKIERKGSGFVATHLPDFMLTDDKWYRGITLRYGPDGSVYTLDWSDTDECHDLEAERETGRIYRISHVAPSSPSPGTPGEGREGALAELSNGTLNLSAWTNQQLIDAQLISNEFLVRHARQILQGRGPNPEVHSALRKLLASGNPLHRLRALWSLHITAGLEEATLLKHLDDPDEHIRAWSIQFLCEDRHPAPAALDRFATLARSDTPLVRLYLASALQRIPFESRWPILEVLVQHEADQGDHNLPLMYWYALEPLVPTDKPRATRLMAQTKIPKLRQFIARRLAGASN